MGERPIPRRRFRLVLDLHADSLDELSIALRSIDFSVTAEGSTNSTSGGCGSGWHYEVTEDAGMTPEKYRADLDAWIAADRAERERARA